MRHNFFLSFLSIITNDCISKGKDYNAGGTKIT